VPSGILSKTAQCVVGNGVVVHLPTLFEEIATLQEQGVSTERLIISERAHLLFDLHKASFLPCWHAREMCIAGELPRWPVSYAMHVCRRCRPKHRAVRDSLPLTGSYGGKVCAIYCAGD
jgi:hypothetical protein